MQNDVTTTRNGFRVEDVTFKNARRQSEIDKETDHSEVDSPNSSQIPVSLTPEQVKSFYRVRIANTSNMVEKAIYNRTIQWIDESIELKKQLIAIEKKQV